MLETSDNKCLDDKSNEKFKSSFTGFRDSLTVPLRKKHQLEDNLAPIVFTTTNMRLGKEHNVTLKVLLGSGASDTMIAKKFCKNSRLKKSSPAAWNMTAGDFDAAQKCKTTFALPESSTSARTEHETCVFDSTLPDCDVIVGRDPLADSGINACFSDQSIGWPRMNAEIPVKLVDCDTMTSLCIQESNQTEEDSDRMSKMLDCKCKKANLDPIANDNKNLDNDEKHRLKDLL